MACQVDPSGTLTGLKNAVDEALDSNPTCLFISSCDDNGFKKTELDPFLQSLPVPVCGGIFPRLIANGQALAKGNIVVGTNHPCSCMIIPDLNDGATVLDKAIDEHFPQSLDVRTVLIYVDGLAQGIQRLIDALFNVFGLEVNYIGGGAGSLSLERKPCIYSRHGILTGGAAIIASSMKSGVGVRHGFKSIAGPFRITEVDGTTIHTLNWEPAFEVYRKAIEAHTGKPVEIPRFPARIANYSFGVNKLGGDVLVRDPIKVLDDGSLVCAGELLEGEFVDILYGDTRSLLDASRQATTDSLANLEDGIEHPLTLFTDCISRYRLLDDDFQEELRNVESTGYPVIGACTFGEIANNGMKYLEMFNQTAVVAQFETS